MTEFTALDGQVDVDSRRELLAFTQPDRNHNGGWIGFSPIDNYLYMAFGDGGGSGDPSNLAQNINVPFGKILRIDVDSRENGEYGIPTSNPRYDGPTDMNPEDDLVWAYGLRNPWRSSFDRETGDLYIADVGQGDWEEVNVQPGDSPGNENYGWKVMEGNGCFADGASGIACFDDSLTAPVHTYAHGNGPDTGYSVTGGYVYRGEAEWLRGTYLFGDFVSAQIWSFQFDGENAVNLQNWTSDLAPDTGNLNDLASFGEDADGNLYVIDLGGQIYRIVPGPTCDLNGDFLVDAADFSVLATGWGTETCRLHRRWTDRCRRCGTDVCRVVVRVARGSRGTVSSRTVVRRAPNCGQHSAGRHRSIGSLGHPVRRTAHDIVSRNI